MNGLLLVVALFGLMWILMIRPQRAKAQQQQRMLASVEPGDEVLTVGGIYGIVQEIESEEEGGDLICEIAEGIHVRVARRALATVVKPESEDDEDDEEGEEDDAELGSGDDGDDGETSVDDFPVEAETESPGDDESGAVTGDDASPEATPPGRS